MLLMFITNDWLNDKEIRYDDKNICRIQSTQEQHWCLYFCWLYASHWLLGSWEELKDHSRIGLCTLNALAIDEPLEYAQLYLDGFSFHLTAPYSEERREAAWEYAREHDAADRLKWCGFVHKFVLYFFNIWAANRKWRNLWNITTL